jgi:EAL domain-containing protein (putative c-di-GMP-specific phosphodiesterase class I)
VLCPSVGDSAAAEALARRIVTSLQQPISIFGTTLSLSASIGVAVSGDATSIRFDLVEDADLAMYAAKRSGRNSVALFSPDLREHVVRRLSLEADLNLGLVAGELACVYQPTVDLATGRIAGVEALLRWNSPSRGRVGPQVFIPVAEESGLIAHVGELVLRQATSQLVQWRAASELWRGITMWVNVSFRQLRDEGFVELVAGTLQACGLPPERLGLEVTESSVMDEQSPALTTLLELRKLGVRIAIDDFGTGYSSLAQLRRLPVDVLKIDRQFIADMELRSEDGKIVETILSMAGSLGLSVVAEGVETDAQRRRLEAYGCPLAQGYLWSRPLAPDDLAELVDGTSGELNRSVLSNLLVRPLPLPPR